MCLANGPSAFFTFEESWKQEEEQMWVVLVTYWAPTNHPWLGYQDSFDLLPDIRLFHGTCGGNLSNYLYRFWHSKTYFN